VSACINRHGIEKLFGELQKKEHHKFPKEGGISGESTKQGVYVIRDEHGTVLHVGRTYGAERGITQRLENHLYGSSSFTQSHFKDGEMKGNAKKLREVCTFQYLDVADDRARAILECYAISWHCPKHLGLSKKKTK
jgi:hypothetical protein